MIIFNNTPLFQKFANRKDCFSPLERGNLHAALSVRPYQGCVRQLLKHLRSQFATSSWGGRRTLPYAFTEHGVLMLSSVLNSERAIQVNIQIMRIYTRIRELLLTHKDMLFKVEQLERSAAKQGEDISLIFNYLKQLVEQKKKPVKRIGYKDFNKQKV